MNTALSIRSEPGARQPVDVSGVDSGRRLGTRRRPGPAPVCVRPEPSCARGSAILLNPPQRLVRTFLRCPLRAELRHGGSQESGHGRARCGRRTGQCRGCPERGEGHRELLGTGRGHRWPGVGGPGQGPAHCADSKAEWEETPPFS